MRKVKKVCVANSNGRREKKSRSRRYDRVQEGEIWRKGG